MPTVLEYAEISLRVYKRNDANRYPIQTNQRGQHQLTF